MRAIRDIGVALCLMGAAAANAQSTNGNQIDSILGIGSFASSGLEKVGYARELILKEAATALGARAGLSDRSRELLQVLNAGAADMDAKFNFNRLVMGSAGVLPPVFSESRDVVALEATAMRVAGVLYHIDEPARFAMPTPTWRNWMYVGLDATPVGVPQLGNNSPTNQAERDLWQRVVKESYQTGRSQADAVFEANGALLKRVHDGMELYFKLWQRGMVSAPIIATSSELVIQEDGNTVAVGNTLYRITAPADFRSFKQWTPLE